MADQGEGHGGTITFGTSSTTINARTIQATGVSREVINTTHLGTTTAKTSAPSTLYDAGQVTVTWLYDPDVQPPFTAAAETITLTHPDTLTNGATSASSGYVINFDEPTMETDAEQIASMTIQRTGAITYTDASA